MCSCACVPGVRIISVGVIECNRECIGVSVLCVPNCTYSTKRNVKLNARWRPDGPGTFIGGNHRSIPFVSFFLSLLILFFLYSHVAFTVSPSVELVRTKRFRVLSCSKNVISKLRHNLELFRPFTYESPSARNRMSSFERDEKDRVVFEL